MNFISFMKIKLLIFLKGLKFFENAFYFIEVFCFTLNIYDYNIFKKHFKLILFLLEILIYKYFKGNKIF